MAGLQTEESGFTLKVEGSREAGVDQLAFFDEVLEVGDGITGGNANRGGNTESSAAGRNGDLGGGFGVGEVHCGAEFRDLFGVRPIGSVELGIEEGGADIKHGFNEGVKAVGIHDFLADLDIIHGKKNVTGEGLAVPAGGFQTDIIFGFRVDGTEDIAEGFHFGLADLRIKEHLVDDVFLFHRIKIIEGEVGQAIAGKKLCDGGADRTAANDVDAAFDIMRGEDIQAFGKIHKAPPLV